MHATPISDRNRSVFSPTTVRESDSIDEWLLILEIALRTQAAFIIAQITGADNLTVVAGRVLWDTKEGYVSVSAIEERCANHGWNSSIYEAWAMERAHKVFAAARSLSEIEKEALFIYAEARQSLDVDEEDAWDAINEVRHAIYGE